MPKKYEDEIREILKGMDDLPGDGPRRPAPPTPAKPSRAPSFQSPFRNLTRNPQQLMGGALILILFAWIMQGPWARGFPEVYRLAGYISLAGIALFIIALIMLLRARGTFGGPGGIGASREQRWRGQVIYLPSRQPFWQRWRHSLSRLFRRAPDNPDNSRQQGKTGPQDLPRW